MRHHLNRLTTTQIKAAKGKDKDYELADGGQLILRVRTNGTKSWLFKYTRPSDKKRTNLGLGKYPEISLARAREKRTDTKELLAGGIDPQNHKQKQLLNSGVTLEHTATDWFYVKKAEISEDYADDVWRSLELHIFPRLGTIPITELDAPTTIHALKPVAAKGTLETVRRVCQRLNEIMTFATNTGLIDHNPLSGINAAFQKPKGGNQPTIEPDQLPAFMSQVYKASIRPTTRHLILWQLHTMVRPGEAAGAEWAEIDLDKGLWTIPAERMKKKKKHIVPLTEQARELLESQKEISHCSKYIFPADRTNRKPANPSTANTAIKRMGYHKILVAHGLRSLASTTLNEQGFNEDLIEVSLAHVDKNPIRAAYNHAKYIERRRKMMSWWSDHINTAATKGLLSKSRKGLSIVNG